MLHATSMRALSTSHAPPPARAACPQVTSNYSGAAQTDLISFESVRRLQLSSPVHVCASEREGFGHYINEARAAGAAIISTDHPPMNELVTEAEGLLVVPERAASYPEMALAPYANISAFLSPQQLCGAVDALLRLPREVRAYTHAVRVGACVHVRVRMHRVLWQAAASGCCACVQLCYARLQRYSVARTQPAAAAVVLRFQEVDRRGQRARQAYLREKAAFLARMKVRGSGAARGVEQLRCTRRSCWQRAATAALVQQQQQHE